MPTIYDLKQAAITETPLFLFETTLRDGSIERWSTHHVVVDGVEFKARVMDHNAFDLKASFDESLDSGNKLSINLANADSHFSQVERHTGFKGARVTVKFVFYDLILGQKAADAMVVFQGVANPPEQTTESSMRLSFGSRLNYQRILLPEVRIQKRCPWTFPSGPAQRSAAVTGGESGRFAPFTDVVTRRIRLEGSGICRRVANRFPHATTAGRIALSAGCSTRMRAGTTRSATAESSLFRRQYWCAGMARKERTRRRWWITRRATTTLCLWFMALRGISLRWCLRGTMAI